MTWIAALLPAAVGVVLTWAGAVKLFGRAGAVAAVRSALPRLVGREAAVPAYRSVGAVELMVGAALLLPPALPAEAAVAAALGVGFVGYLTYARIAAPGSSCGCMGDRPTPVRGRAFARAGLLTAAAALAALATLAESADQRWWGQAALDHPAAALAVLLGFTLATAALSEELDHRWLLPLRRLRLRLRHPLRHTMTGAGTGAGDAPIASSVQQLLASPAYRTAGGWVSTDLQDSWPEGEWRVLSYGARYGDRQATAVFAVPRTHYDPSAVRAALVDETDRTVLWTTPVDKS